MFKTKDQSIHAKCEGMVKFTRELLNKKYVSTVHIIPAMDINRTVKYPKPFVYHPEQFPELEEFNPAFTNWRIPESSLASYNKKKAEKIQFKYRKLYKISKEYDIDEFLSTSKDFIINITVKEEKKELKKESPNHMFIFIKKVNLEREK